MDFSVEDVEVGVLVEEEVDESFADDVDELDSVFEGVDSVGEPFTEEDEDERESVMYQPLPLKTMPTGWITLRSAPPQRSQVVSGWSEKL